VLDRRHSNYYRNKKVSSDERIEVIKNKRQNPFERDIMKPILNAEQLESDDKPLDFVSTGLKSYIDDLRAM